MGSQRLDGKRARDAVLRLGQRAAETDPLAHVDVSMPRYLLARLCEHDG